MFKIQKYHIYLQMNETEEEIISIIVNVKREQMKYHCADSFLKKCNFLLKC